MVDRSKSVCDLYLFNQVIPIDVKILFSTETWAVLI